MSSTLTDAQVNVIMAQANRASDTIIANLLDRRGLSHEYMNCDPEVQEEIRDKWADLIEEHMKNLVSRILDEIVNETAGLRKVGRALWKQADRAPPGLTPNEVDEILGEET